MRVICECNQKYVLNSYYQKVLLPDLLNTSVNKIDEDSCLHEFLLNSSMER